MFRRPLLIALIVGLQVWKCTCSIGFIKLSQKL